LEGYESEQLNLSSSPAPVNELANIKGRLLIYQAKYSKFKA